MPRRYINHHHYAALLTGIALVAISLYHLAGN